MNLLRRELFPKPKIFFSETSKHFFYYYYRIQFEQFYSRKNYYFILYKDNTFSVIEYLSFPNRGFKILYSYNFSNNLIKNFTYDEVNNYVILIGNNTSLFVLKLDKFELIEYPNLIEFPEQMNKIYSFKGFYLFLSVTENFYYILIEKFLNYLKIKEQKEKEKDLNNIEINIMNIDSIIPIKFEKQYSKIKDISYSETNIMIIDETNSLYFFSTSEFSKINNIEPTFKLVSEQKFNNYYSMSNGENFWLLLEKKIFPPLEEWTTNEIYKWFEELKFYDYLNIIKYEKITGKDIYEGDCDFFRNCIGMNDDNIKKLNYEISKIKKGLTKYLKLWGWGNNKNGQLGMLNYNLNYIKVPSLIPLPEFQDNESVEKIYCGKGYSLIISNFGNVFITGNYNIKDKISKDDDQNNNHHNINMHNNYNKGGNDKHNKKNKKENNNKDKLKEQTNIKNQNRWINVTKDICFNCNKINDGKYLKIKNIFCKDGYILFFGYHSNIIPYQAFQKIPKLKHSKNGGKFITSNKVIDNILELKNNEKENYKIVYGDKILKMLETSLNEFIQSHVPYHKVEQIKLFNDVIWDKKKRFFKEELFN